MKTITLPLEEYETLLANVEEQKKQIETVVKAKAVVLNRVEWERYRSYRISDSILHKITRLPILATDEVGFRKHMTDFQFDLELLLGELKKEVQYLNGELKKIDRINEKYLKELQEKDERIKKLENSKWYSFLIK